MSQDDWLWKEEEEQEQEQQPLSKSFNVHIK